MDGGFFLIMLLIAAGIIGFSMHQSKQVSEAWSMAARVLQLAYVPGGWMQERRLSGKIQGSLVVVETITRGSGKSSSKYTRYRVSHSRPLRLGLQVRKEGFLSGMAKTFGAQDIQVGDPDFDARVLVKGNDPDAVIHFLTRDRRMKILQAITRFDDFSLDDTGAQYECSGTENESHTLIRKIRQLVEFVQSMEDAHTPASPPTLPTSVTATPPAAKPKPAAKPVAKPAHRPPPLPAPPPLPQSKPVPHSTTSPQKPVNQGPTPASSQPAVAQEAARASDVGAALFVGNQGIAQAERWFATEFANRTIEGHGILRHAKTSGFDFVFGSGSCVIATIDVPLPTADPYGRHSFQVIVCMPTGTPCPAIGANITFHGTLVKVDALMRQLFVRSE